MKLLYIVLPIAMWFAFLSHQFYPIPLAIFLCAAIALILLSKLLGDATEQLSLSLGERTAGLVNVTLSNLAELIIIFVAVKEAKIELVQAGIVGSIMGNLLFVMGLSIYLGCRKNGTLGFNHDTVTLFVNQLFLVGATILLPTIFNGSIPANAHEPLSIILSVMLVGAYIYFYRLSAVDPRFNTIERQSEGLHRRWTARRSLIILAGCAVAAFFMSELLVKQVEHVSHQLGLSTLFVGFILLPILGNIAEHFVAVTAARKKMVELSLSISVGSAAQVGMIVAPAAVLFGLILGNPVTLHFADLPVAALVVSFVATFLTLHDDRWNVNEGAALLALYGAIVTCFAFAR